MNLSLLTQQKFGAIVCDFWQNDRNDVFMTREQIGEALEYSNPAIAISKIHNRNNDRLDRFSVVTRMVSTDGKQYETTIYNERGIYEIARFSRQPKANEFYDFVYDLLEGLRKGNLTVVQRKPDSYMIDDPVERAKRWIEEQQEHKENKKLADYTRHILNSDGTVTISQIAADYGMSGQRMNKILHELGVQYKINKQWLLYSKHKGKGYTDSYTIDIDHTDGRQSARMQTNWTQTGRLFIYELLKANGILPTMEQHRLRLLEGKKQIG